MSAYPAPVFGSDWRSAPVPSRSPPFHLDGFSSSTSISEYPETQSVVIQGLPAGQQDSKSSPCITGPRGPLRNGDGDPRVVKADPDRSINLRLDLDSQIHQGIKMECPPLEQKLMSSTATSPASQPQSSGAPVEADNLSEEEEELALTASEVDENATDVGAARSAMARPTERRKLKRFRLVG